MTDTQQVAYIEIRYEDGSADVAEGEAAAAIWEYLKACAVLAVIHGGEYTGPTFTRKAAKG